MDTLTAWQHLISSYYAIYTPHFLIALFFIIIAFLSHLYFKYRPSKLGQQVAAFSGDDVFTTKLDLAKAYIEMDEKEAARPLLNEVSSNGTGEQRVYAQNLLKSL